jgi:hypothetical protein
MDALTQSAIQIHRHSFRNGTTSIPVTTFFDGAQLRSSGEELGDQLPYTSVLMAMQFGASYDSGLDYIFNPTFRVSCASGNCTFPKYQSLGVFGSCYDRTTDLVKSETDTETYYTLPGTDSDLVFYTETSSGASDIIMADSSTVYPDRALFGDVGPMIATTSTIIDFWNDPVAIQCALYWTVKTYQAAVNLTTGYRLDEEQLNVTASFYGGDTKYRQTDPIRLEPDECWVNGTNYSAKDGNGHWTNQNCLFEVSSLAQVGIQNAFMDKAYGFVGGATLNAPNTKNFSNMNHYTMNVYAITKDIEHRADVFAAVRDMTSNVALMIERSIRVVADKPDERAKGIVWSTDFRYKIRWERMTLPILLVLGSAVFLLLTALVNRGDFTWKRSNLPLLFHGLGNREKREAGDVSEYADMKSVARHMAVKLVRTEEGVRLVSGEHRFDA